MDPFDPFGDVDTDAICGKQQQDLEAIADDPSRKPQLFQFAIASAEKPHDSTAKTTICKFRAFKNILNDPEELRLYGSEFKRWFKDKKANDKRKETHVSFDFASFHIEPEEEALFLERQSVALAAGRAFYMVERPTPVMRLFIDLDFKNLAALSGAGIEAAAMVVGRAVLKFFPSKPVEDPFRNGRMVVCCTDTMKTTQNTASGKASVLKTGIHIHWPNIFVTGTQAMTIRETILADLIATFGPRMPPQQNPWEDVVDGSVFQRDEKEGSGLRMQGSRKAEPCPECKGGKNKNPDGSRQKCPNKYCACGKIDAGRPQHLLFATDGSLRRCTAQEKNQIDNLQTLVQEVSIRCHKNFDAVESGSEGFSVPVGAPLQMPKKSLRMAKIFKGDSIGATGPTKARDVEPGSLQEHLQNLIRESFGNRQNQVVVTTVKQQLKDKSFIVNITGYNAHQCQNIGREHKSNRIYFSVSVEGIVQRCYDPSDALSDEMRFGLCKTQASAPGSIPKKYRDALWPSDEAVTVQTSHETDRPKSSLFSGTRLKTLLNQGDMLCQKLFGSSWSITLNFENNQKMLKNSHSFVAMGPEDIGLKSREALVHLGFEKPPEEIPSEERKVVKFESPLAILEDNVWTSFRAWIEQVASLDEDQLQHSNIAGFEYES